MTRFFLFLACVALFLCLDNRIDARCGGAASRRSTRMERREARRGYSTMTVTYSSRSYMVVPMLRQAPACESCAPAQAPPMKK